MENNPYTPPQKNNHEAERPSSPKNHIVTLAIIHALFVASYLPVQIELVRVGVINALGPFLGAISFALSLVAVVFLLTKHKGKTLFLIAGIGFLLATALIFNSPLSAFLKHSTYTLGACYGLFSWWFIRRYQIELVKFQADSTLRPS